MNKQMKEKIRKKLISEHTELFSQGEVNHRQLEMVLLHIIDNIVKNERINITEEDRKKIIAEMMDEFVGFGPLEKMLKDPHITEIMINGKDKVYVEKNGRKEKINFAFDSEEQIMNIIHKMLMPTRRRVDESYPYTDVSLSDGSRVNIIITPISLDGPSVTIRKFLSELKDAKDLIDLGTLDKRMSDLLIACIKAKINIIFSGATGAGKTTTLNVFSRYIPEGERIITIEDTAELYLSQDHIVRLEARQPNIEGKGEVTIRDLFKNSLRMRPNRIILGEIRGAEALDMLQAICSGHRGSLSVLHANSPEDVIYRIETMILTSGIPISLEAIHRQINTAIHLIVQQEQLVDGSRKITYITQVNGIKGDEIVLEDIFVYDMEGLDSQGKVQGKWRATGIVPAFYPIFKKMGIDLPQEIFNKD